MTTIFSRVYGRFPTLPPIDYGRYIRPPSAPIALESTAFDDSPAEKWCKAGSHFVSPDSFGIGRYLRTRTCAECLARARKGWK